MWRKLLLRILTVSIAFYKINLYIFLFYKRAAKVALRQVSSFSRWNLSQLIQIFVYAIFLAFRLYRIVKDFIYILFNHLDLWVLIWLLIYHFFGIQILWTYNNFVYNILIIFLFTQKLNRLLLLKNALLIKINSLFLQIKLFRATCSLDLIGWVIFLILTL